MAIKVQYVYETPRYEMYNRCTLLYDPETERGLAVVELRKSPNHPIFWFDCVTATRLNDVVSCPSLEMVFEGKAGKVGPFGEYPTMGILQLRQALGLSDPPHEIWEEEYWKLYKEVVNGKYTDVRTDS